MEMTDAELWEIWNEQFSDEFTLIDFMAVAEAVINSINKNSKD